MTDEIEPIPVIVRGEGDDSPMAEARALLKAVAASMNEKVHSPFLATHLALQMDAGAAHQMISQAVILSFPGDAQQGYTAAVLALGTAVGALIVNLTPESRQSAINHMNMAVDGAISKIELAQAEAVGGTQ